MSLKEVRSEIKGSIDPKRAILLQKYFKTGKGDYGEGDIFIGLTVPQARSIARKYILSLDEIKQLLISDIHEERFIALEALVYMYSKTNESAARESIYNFYLENTSRINNWDLVDTSAYHVVGRHLLDKERKILRKLAKSDNIWERRIAIVATNHFIRNNQLDDTFRIVEILMGDKHDLIHKACGWMLREAGKKDVKALEGFLAKHYKSMPRTMLRYAIERFDEKRRKSYLKGTI